MSDMDPNFDRETFETLANFVGQTYNEICKYDQSLISTNSNLNSKREQFKSIAENVLAPPSVNRQQSHNVPRSPMPLNNQNVKDMPYIDRGIQPLPPPPNDPNQLEFMFDNSEISLKIEKKFDTIVSRLNRIDKTLNQLLEYLNYEAEDIES
jgi:hypothetical protein